MRQPPLAAASRQRPARSIGGGCGGGGGGGGDGCACSLGAAVSWGVLVHAPTAASARSRPAATPLRLIGPLHTDVIMQKVLADQPWVAPKCIRSHLVFDTRNCAMADDRGMPPGDIDYCPALNSSGDDPEAGDARFDEGKTI
jgi:hypothetical protein